MAKELVEKEVMDAEQIHRIIDEHTTTPQIKPGTNVAPAATPPATFPEGEVRDAGRAAPG
jgi:hypothetical protein